MLEEVVVLPVVPEVAVALPVVLEFDVDVAVTDVDETRPHEPHRTGHASCICGRNTQNSTASGEQSDGSSTRPWQRSDVAVVAVAVVLGAVVGVVHAPQRAGQTMDSKGAS